MAKENTAPVLTVSAPPHWHSGRTIPRYMQDTLLAMLPAVVMAVYYYGFEALQVMALSCATAVAAEALSCKLMGRECSVHDMSALVLGLTFAFIMPASSPWWLIVAGSGVSVVMGKMIFGGLGSAPMMAALVGWAVLRISWPDQMMIYTNMIQLDLVSPLSQLQYFGLEDAQQVSYWQMLVGAQKGPLGAVQVLPLLIGAAWLYLRGWLKLYIPLGFLAGVAGMALIYWAIDPSVYAGPLFHLLAGSTVFGAFFLAVNPSSSPVGKAPMVLFGVLAGVMVMIIRIYGMYPDGVMFAVLFANLFAPLLDMIKPKPFGAR
jgi:electron transport complex protein RnfD